MIEVVGRGVATSVRDAGRLGLAHLGKSRGGAVDREALALANRLVGNPDRAPGIETSGGLTLRVTGTVMVAMAGSRAEVRVHGGRALGWGAPGLLPRDAVVHIGTLHDGARLYLSVRGGVVERPDGHLDVGPDPGTPAASTAAVPHPISAQVRIWPGPRRDWFAEEAWVLLGTAPFSVSPDSDRVGVRLVGPVLERLVTAELPSEGVIEGAIQVPPSGRPVIMLADHPTTGGYPVIAVVDPADLAAVAQARPGGVLRFRSVS